MRAEWVIVAGGLYLLAVVQVASMAANAWSQNRPCEPATLTMNRTGSRLEFTVGENCPLNYDEFGFQVGGDSSCQLGPLKWEPGPVTRTVAVEGRAGAACVVHVTHVGRDVGAYGFVVGGAG